MVSSSFKNIDFANLGKKKSLLNTKKLSESEMQELLTKTAFDLFTKSDEFRLGDDLEITQLTKNRYQIKVFIKSSNRRFTFNLSYEKALGFNSFMLYLENDDNKLNFVYKSKPDADIILAKIKEAINPGVIFPSISKKVTSVVNMQKVI